jgi:hypothetical protein
VASLQQTKKEKNMPEVPSVVTVKKFLEHNAQPISMAEMTTFWKSLTEDEKTEYRNTVAKWDGSSTFIQ